MSWQQEEDDLNKMYAEDFQENYSKDNPRIPVGSFAKDFIQAERLWEK